jgi:hypothetical protein
VIGWLRSGLRLLFPPENGCNARAPSLPHTRPPPNLGKLLSLPRFLQVPSTPTVTPLLTSVTHSSSPRNSRPSPSRRSPAAGHASVSVTVSESIVSSGLFARPAPITILSFASSRLDTVYSCWSTSRPSAILAIARRVLCSPLQLSLWEYICCFPGRPPNGDQDHRNEIYHHLDSHTKHHRLFSQQHLSRRRCKQQHSYYPWILVSSLPYVTDSVSSIPIFVACVVLFFIHRAHLKRVRREEKNDKDFDMDAGVGELPGPAPGSGNSDLGSIEKQDPYRDGRAASLRDMDLQPPPPALPYLVPKANVSRESLHSLSDPRDNPYAAIYTSAPPSPTVGAFSPFSDQASISGRSGRSLLAPSMPHDQSLNLALKPPSRAPSPLAIADYHQPQQSRDESPPNATGPSRVQSFDVPPPSPAKLQSRSPLRERQVQEAEVSQENPFSPESTNPAEVSDVPQNRIADPKTYTEHPANTFAATYPESTGEHAATPINNAEGQADSTQTSREISAYGSDFDERRPNSRIEGETFHTQTSHTYHDTEFRVEGEADEDRAKRIQSVYKEYWNDSQYYDGSEDWEALQQNNQNGAAYEPRPPMPPKNIKPAWRDSAQDYYETQDWQHDNRGYGYEHYDQTQPRHHFGLGIDSQWDSPPPRPSHYSRPSTSYSTSSVPSRTRTPSKPLEPLQDLPTTRYKLDELASPISFSKPRRFVGTGGRDSPARPASPAQVLSSSWSNLAELPVPHRLRRSGSFSSLDFAPVRKFAPSEVDAGDTGSIRSFARTEANLMAVSAGAGRVDRLPHDLVPMGKSGAMTNLRPQNYGDIRYF